ncbi:class A beta-lactamase [Pyruvatibacter mobilis]|uniref:class A beta-lactamase n=1 Tax=Pyruvatibacter mobilis TaxID=1712261 RepID=UPI003BAF2E79
MPSAPSRRQALAATVLAGSALAAATPAAARAGTPPGPPQLDTDLAALEARHGGCLGVAILDPATGEATGHRADERFLLMSTFKALAAAFVLTRVEDGDEQLDRRITHSEADLIPWSPVTKHHTGAPGMTVAALCDAAVTWSDNTAGNLLLESVGGPASLTAYLRGLGDDMTRLDRIEPALNLHDGPDDIRDTTTPAAMAATLRTLLFTDALAPAARDQLTAWLITSKTGGTRLRAGVPDTWLVGDKTGTNTEGAAADIGVIWPLGHGPLIIVAYCDMPALTGDARNAVFAEVAKLAAQHL